ncbi:hypothetical protein AVEN_99174-1 [Araneus ventricosus]|uniref:Uncharacterized protein n=1 Tax=Araneus ventricosus TaxID=182803 RepID=A0A4Y2CI00_ARAVE|nr:hypothetical protein AVEN_99174-1 [Araneus ventricosus]
MKRTTLELALSPNFRTTPTLGRLITKSDSTHNSSHTCRSFSGAVEPGTFRLRRRDLTNRSTAPPPCNCTEFGDKKPSTLLYAMKSWASDGISPELLKSLWKQRLPIQIQQILSVSDDNLQALSKMADSIFEISKDDLVVSVSDNFQFSDVNMFENRLAAIENRLSRLEVRRRSLLRGNTEVRGSNKRKYCWWHFKFGNRAKKCEQPCTFKSEN